MKQTSVGISYCTGPYKDVLKQINLERLAAHGMDIGSTFLDPFFCVPKKHRMNIIYSHYEKLNAHLVHKLIFQRKDTYCKSSIKHSSAYSKLKNFGAALN